MRLMPNRDSHAAAPTAARSSLGRGSGLGVALGLSMLVLAVTLLRTFGELDQFFNGGKSTYMARRGLESPSLTLEIALFAGALMLVYLAVGLTAFATARLTEYALNRPRVDRPRLVAVAFILVYSWIHIANAAWFRNSLHAGELHAPLAQPRLAGLSIADALSLALGAGLCLVLVLALWRARQHLAIRRSGWTLGLATAGACAFLLLTGHREAPAQGATGSPNVIIVGIDSLRCDMTALGEGRTLTPNVDAFLEESHVFTDTITPLARTFPAWVSILTGRHPMSTGARINLTARDLIHEGDTLADILVRRGYRAVLATDEVRFSNIDQSYGFDQMIAPRIGASDFLLATFNDFPVTNLVNQTRLGAWLFPNSYANRAAYKSYDPDSFVSRLDRELRPEGPTLLAVHLTLAHWPYAWKDLQHTTALASFREQYPMALGEVDRQFASVMAVLGSKGLLDNAIVVLLSDHGEAVGFPGDSLLPKGWGDPEMRWNSLWGHGTSVLSAEQYRTLLAFRSFGDSRVARGHALHDVPASLEDVTPTLLDLLDVDTPEPFDGLSLASFLDGTPPPQGALAGRIRFTESEFNPPALFAGKNVDEAKVALQTAYDYLVTPEGRLQLREESLQRIIRNKELAALQGGSKLAAVPDASGRRTYYWFDSRRPFPVRLTRPPDPAELPDAAGLFSALATRFPGEVEAPAPSRTPAAGG